MPIDTTNIKTLYVFVEISIDSQHLLDTVRHNIPDNADDLREQLLNSEDNLSAVPAGSSLASLRHLRVSDINEGANAAAGQDGCSGASRRPSRLALVSTIQFAAALQKLKEGLSNDDLPGDKRMRSPGAQQLGLNYSEGKYDAIIPRSKPLSPGEILGCTAPTIEGFDALLLVNENLL